MTWNTTTWEKLGSKKIVRDSISAFSVSADGKFLAVYKFHLFTLKYLRKYNFLLSFEDDPRIFYR